jgi:uncharacterized protein (DUF305 family)
VTLALALYLTIGHALHPPSMPGKETMHKRFIDMMVPHHVMAIEMVELELSQGSHAQLEQTARGIIAAQQGEIATMKALRKRLLRLRLDACDDERARNAEHGDDDVRRDGGDAPV